MFPRRAFLRIGVVFFFADDFFSLSSKSETVVFSPFPGPGACCDFPLSLNNRGRGCICLHETIDTLFIRLLKQQPVTTRTVVFPFLHRIDCFSEYIFCGLKFAGSDEIDGKLIPPREF